MKTRKITERYCRKCDAFTETEVIERDTYNGHIINEGYNRCKACGKSEKDDIDLFEFRETGNTTFELTQREIYLIAGWVKCLGMLYSHDFIEEETELCTKIIDAAYPENKGANPTPTPKKRREPIPTEDMTHYDAKDIVKYVGMKDSEPAQFTQLTNIGFCLGVTKCGFCGQGVSYNSLKPTPLFCADCIAHARGLVTKEDD